MNLKKFFALPLLLTCCFFFSTAYADTVDMSSVGESPSGVTKPGNGMTMDAVLKQYGEPEGRQNPVGEPPITRWNFAQFTVYFEHNQVIHSVSHR